VHARGLQLPLAFTNPFYDIDVESDLTRLAADCGHASGQGAANGGLAETVGQTVAQCREQHGEL